MAATASKPDAEPEVKHFAVYDNTLLKFCSPVFDKKSEADEAKKNGPKGHDLEVREV